MQRYEITYRSANTEKYSKPITALIIEPGVITETTGAMLFTHGWGGNRFQNVDKMEFTADAFGLVCISVEFRQSGFDFDPVHGGGWDIPYDASFYQVFDVLNGLRTVLQRQGHLNRRRLFHYGGSQGGHIALLTSIYAPRTFAFVYASCPVVHLDETIRTWAGREFAPHELSIRSVIDHAESIACPVVLDHGTADSSVCCDTHTRALKARLKSLGKTVTARYYEGGQHGLQPVSSRLDAFKATAPEPMRTLTTTGADDFTAGHTVEIPCGDRTLVIDWSKPPDSAQLFRWIKREDKS